MNEDSKQNDLIADKSRKNHSKQRQTNRIKEWMPSGKGTVLLCMLMTICLISAICFRLKAASIGSKAGSSLGNTAGKAIGSLEGITKGRSEGSEAGKKQGLSAEDTKAEISSQIKHMGSLEVMAASVNLSNFHTIGEKNSHRYYAALYLCKGSVVFTVDLNEAEITSDESGLHIELSRPRGTLYIDNSTIEKAAEYQTKFFDGSAEEGFDAYLKSMEKIHEASTETLDNYEELLKNAKDMAEDRISYLVNATGSEGKVDIKWSE